MQLHNSSAACTDAFVCACVIFTTVTVRVSIKAEEESSSNTRAVVMTLIQPNFSATGKLVALTILLQQKYRISSSSSTSSVGQYISVPAVASLIIMHLLVVVV
jgi:hypothetical protein